MHACSGGAPGVQHGPRALRASAGGALAASVPRVNTVGAVHRHRMRIGPRTASGHLVLTHQATEASLPSAAKPPARRGTAPEAL